ncbi:hypothetical protein BW28_06020 [Clostridioides difficile]|nr:hypothetical protein BW28_06020 [Clostridioides difficile]
MTVRGVQAGAVFHSGFVTVHKLRRDPVAVQVDHRAARHVLQKAPAARKGSADKAAVVFCRLALF